MNTDQQNAIATMDHHAKNNGLPTWSELKAKVDAGNGKTAEPAPLDLTKPVQTRGGCPVRILCMDAKGTFPIVALVTCLDGSEMMAMYTPNGDYMHRGMTYMDLINVKPKV